VSQLLHKTVALSVVDGECMAQSAGMDASGDMLSIFACDSALAAMFTAIASPVQPRKGSKTSIKAINRRRVNLGIFK
jgi:hypothetical protein